MKIPLVIYLACALFVSVASGDQQAISKRLQKAMFEKYKLIPQPVTSAALYPDILASGLIEAKLTAHFPPDIGSAAKLIFMPAFMQGGAFLQVAVPATKKQMDRLATKYADKPRLADLPGEDGKGGGEGMRPLCYLCGGSPSEAKPFPNEHDVVMLVMEDHEGGFHWNHGRLAGITFDRAQGRVIYWMQSW